ncbi:MAG: hypothetical protein QW544_06005 [Candidatus Caldarchaeum sp.]
MHPLKTAYVPLLILLLSLPAVLGQMQDPCVVTQNKYSLQDSLQPITGNLTGRLQERFYRLENLRPSEMVTLSVKLTANTSASVSMLMLWEIRMNQFTHVSTEQTIISGGPHESTFSWTHANTGNNQPTNICFKVGLFSEARPAKVDYTIAVSVEKLQDTGGGDAADKPERAMSIGKIQTETPVTISGYLTSDKQGIDHVDFYVFTAALGKGKELVATLTTREGNIYEAAILDQTLFTLRYNQTAGKQKATIVLENEEPAEKTYYLKISNNGGVGGGGPYTVTLEIRQTTAITSTATKQTTVTQTLEQPTIPPETARAIVYGSVVGVAAVAVAATVLARRRSQTYVVEEGW